MYSTNGIIDALNTVFTEGNFISGKGDIRPEDLRSDIVDKNVRAFREVISRLKISMSDPKIDVIFKILENKEIINSRKIGGRIEYFGYLHCNTGETELAILHAISVETSKNENIDLCRYAIIAFFINISRILHEPNFIMKNHPDVMMWPEYKSINDQIGVKPVALNTVPTPKFVLPNETIDAFAKEEKRITDTIVTFVDAQKAEITKQIMDATKAVETDSVLVHAYQLWKNKSLIHHFLFAVGALLFFGGIYFAVYFTISNWEFIWAEIELRSGTSKPTNGETPQFNTMQFLSRTVLISLPIATMVWILRAILRWANMNLSLAQDASQRHVLAKTYVSLLARGAIKQDKEREIMLSALFRPLPGIKEIDVTPTSIFNMGKNDSE